MFAARLLRCKGDGNAGVGSGRCVVAVSAYMGGTHGSGVLASAGDMLEMSVVTALHILNNTVAKRVQQNGSPCAKNQCSTRYEQSFRHNKHTHTNQKAATDKHPATIIKFIPNYIKGRKAYTTYINHTSKQCQFKSFHPHYLTFTPQTYHHPVNRFMS